MAKSRILLGRIIFILKRTVCEKSEKRTHVFKKGTILKIWNVLFDLNICLRDNLNIIHSTNKIPFGHV